MDPQNGEFHDLPSARAMFAALEARAAAQGLTLRPASRAHQLLRPRLQRLRLGGLLRRHHLLARRSAAHPLGLTRRAKPKRLLLMQC